MAQHLGDSWLQSCSQELELPGSPWYEVRERISKYLLERIRLEGLTSDELAKLRYLLGQEFTSKYKLVRNENFSDARRPNLSDEKLESLLKDLTLKAAKDANCFLKKDLDTSPDSFQSLVSLVTEVFDSSLYSHMQAMRMTQFKQFGSNTSVIALNSLVDKDIEILGEAVVKILQKDPKRLDNVSKRLRGRLLPVALRRLIYRLVLIKKQKHSGYPGSDIGVGVLSYDDKITQQGLREGFAKGTIAGLKALKSKDPMKSPLQHLIHLAVIEAYETLPGLRLHAKNMEIQKECSQVLNILYTYSKNFRRTYILWLFPLQITISQDRFAKEHCYELAMWLNCVVKSCAPLDAKYLNTIVLEVWRIITEDDHGSVRSHDFNQHLSKLRIKSDLKSVEMLLDVELPLVNGVGFSLQKLASPSVLSFDSQFSVSTYENTSQWTVFHPALCLRQWLTDLFVGVTDLPVTIFLWDQFFLYNWDPSVLAISCAALFLTMQNTVLKSSDVESLCSDLLDKAVDVKLYEIHRAWNDISLKHEKS